MENTKKKYEKSNFEKLSKTKLSSCRCTVPLDLLLPLPRLLSSQPTLVPGVWGPFYSALLPSLWLMEGGMSATGALLDHVIASHPALDQVQSSSCLLHPPAPSWKTWRGSRAPALTPPWRDT